MISLAHSGSPGKGAGLWQGKKLHLGAGVWEWLGTSWQLYIWSSKVRAVACGSGSCQVKADVHFRH